MMHWSNVCSLHVSGPVVSTVPTKQEELLLTHFKLVLVNRGITEAVPLSGHNVIAVWRHTFVVAVTRDVGKVVLCLMLQTELIN